MIFKIAEYSICSSLSTTKKDFLSEVFFFFLTILQKSLLSAQSVLIATMASPLSKAALISLPPFCTLFFIRIVFS